MIMRDGLLWISHVIFSSFLIIASWQDLRRKQVQMWVFLVFGTLAGTWFLCFAGAEIFSLLKNERTKSIGSILCQTVGQAGIWVLPALVPGLLLFWSNRISGGAVGSGDSLFFLITGVLLGWETTVSLFLASTGLCGIFCLALYVWYRVVHGENASRRTVPFLPFAALAEGMMLLGKITSQ